MFLEVHVYAVVCFTHNSMLAAAHDPDTRSQVFLMGVPYSLGATTATSRLVTFTYTARTKANGPPCCADQVNCFFSTRWFCVVLLFSRLFFYDQGLVLRPIPDSHS